MIYLQKYCYLLQKIINKNIEIGNKRIITHLAKITEKKKITSTYLLHILCCLIKDCLSIIALFLYEVASQIILYKTYFYYTYFAIFRDSYSDILVKQIIIGTHHFHLGGIRQIKIL